MHNEHDDDHSLPTHSANCDSCGYVAKAHAHDEEGAVQILSQDLASHNQSAHQMETDPTTIHDAVRGKMQPLG
ncbi:MAG: hypothetical protein WEC39_02265 [Patescibacteria group bacterium]